MTSAGKGPLTGLRVVELARVLAGPWAGQTLSDLGAEVIKVEAPQGDDTRQWGPPFVTRDDDVSAAYFHSTNRGKASVIIDFKTEAGQVQLRELIGTADILIENFKVLVLHLLWHVSVHSRILTRQQWDRRAGSRGSRLRPTRGSG